METPSRPNGSTLDAMRSLVLARGQELIGHVAVGLGLGDNAEDAIGDACEADEDVACLVAALLDGLDSSEGLRDAIARAVRDYFDVGEAA